MKHAVLLFASLILAQLSIAQNVSTQKTWPASTPETEYYKQQLTEQVQKQLDKIDWNHVDRTTSGGTVLYTIPVVVHVLHNYGSELLADNDVYKMIDSVNSYFLKTNADTINIIDKFKPVAANTQIAFKLAPLDPNGNPTKGVEHIFTYLTYGHENFPNQSKLQQWPHEKYLNIWTENTTSLYSPGYSYRPYNADAEPYYDGVVINAEYILYGSSLAHFAAEYLGLPYPCGSSPTSSCIDNDLIADTPPCGNLLYCSNLYDTTCDTPNIQNIMNGYGNCLIMLTYGQGQYMQNVLQFDHGKRDSLVTLYTASTTGMNQPGPDLLPIADFSVGGSSLTSIAPRRFYCQGQNVLFTNHSWNDTLTNATWTFSNNANIPASSSLTSVTNKFHQHGWVTVTLQATGNNTGSSTLTDPNALFVADSIATAGAGYQQEFYPGTGMNKWPMFNYYNNSFKWQLANVGYFDNNSLEYTSYDARTFPDNATGSPQGDLDDIYTPGFDLTGFPDSCYLNFMSSGATLTSIPAHLNDSLEIDYSTNALTWNKLKVLKGEQLANKGVVTTPYTPSSASDWMPNAILLPATARTAYTLFRFRYYPGANDSTGISSGNNFYLDHFNFGGSPESVAVEARMPEGVSVQPNPTQGATDVIVKGTSVIHTATVIVTDITGKVLYKVTDNNNGNVVRIALPANVFTAKGIYLIHVTTGSINQTEKLIVY